MLIIRPATSPQDFFCMAQLIAEFVAFLRLRYQHDNWFVTEVFDQQSLVTELQALSGTYGPPGGQAFVAFDRTADGEVAVACGAYKDLGQGVCEMKRVFVSDRGRGTGIGKKLVLTLIEAARNEGYEVMKLDTGALLTEAISLYKSLGFRECEPYIAYPEKLIPYLRFMSLSLTCTPCPEDPGLI